MTFETYKEYPVELVLGASYIVVYDNCHLWRTENEGSLFLVKGDIFLIVDIIKYKVTILTKRGAAFTRFNEGKTPQLYGIRLFSL